MAGRLHDRLAQIFGRDKLFMDVDHIPAGTDFVAHLNSQVAECDVVLVVIGPGWLGAKDESGERRLDNPDDFVAIEIAAALARNIRVIPVLVDGARMPKASQLPDSLKPLARRQAVDVRHSHFGHDAEALVARMREALGGDATGRRPWRMRTAIGAVALAALLLIGWSGYAYIAHMLTTVEQAAQRREVELRAELAKAAAEAEAKRKAEEAEQQRLAAAKAEQERRDKAAAEAKAAAAAEEKRKAEEAEQRRLMVAKAEQERQAEATRRAEQAERERVAAANAEQERFRAEAAARADPALAQKPGSGQSFRDRLVDGQPCQTCPEMVLLPAGDVMMGSPETERGRSEEEGPQHRVTIAGPFAIGKFPVTRGEFAAFVRETGYRTEGGCDVWTGSDWRRQSDRSWRSPSSVDQDDRHPVVCVNWHDAKAYAAWLSKKVGKRYRLLTEAEREYAARARTNTRYSFGDDEAWLSEYAWYQANSGGATHPVGEKKPNLFGLFDMHGNAWAWCEDIWHSSYRGAPNDGSVWQTGDTPLRILRGGSWYRNASGLRSAFRVAFSPDGRYNDVGFRVARGL
jgi:formylglycine-generating enzyme required for sulfatase activity